MDHDRTPSVEVARLAKRRRWTEAEARVVLARASESGGSLSCAGYFVCPGITQPSGNRGEGPPSTGRATMVPRLGGDRGAGAGIFCPIP